MQQLTSCPCCSGSKLSLWMTCKDHTVTKKEFQIDRCETCGLLFTNPRPSEDELGGYYKSEEYVSHSNTKKGLINKLYHGARSLTLVKKLQLIGRYKKQGFILDVGCGTGEFLNFCHLNKWTTKGIEPDPEARRYGQENYKLSIGEEGQIDLLPDRSFDVITMWHVLEHVPNLKKRIDEIYRKLKNDGVLFIAVPNCESWDAKKYGPEWAAYDVPRHLYHFTPKTIEFLFENNKFKLDKTLPMPLDSFYVSWLSEKYRNSGMAFAKGMLAGLFSNLKALANGKRYSSQIYVFRKKK